MQPKCRIVIAALAAAVLAGCTSKIVVEKAAVPRPVQARPATAVDGAIDAMMPAVASALTSGGGQQASKQKPKLNYVFYALPATVVRADVTVERTEKKKGEYVKFTPKFFPDEGNYIKADSHSYSFKAGSIDTFTLPDLDQVYRVKVTGGLFDNLSLTLDTTEDGVLTKTDAEVTDTTMEVVTSTITGVTGALLRSGVLVGAAELSKVGKSHDCGPSEADCQAAKKIADNIGDLEMSLKDLITTGGNVVEGREAMITELKAEIERLRARYFFGTVTKKEWTGKFVAQPPARTDGQPPAPFETELFQYSADGGICSVGSGQLVIDPPRETSGCTPDHGMWLVVEPDPRQLFQAVDGQYDEGGERGFRYRIPAAARALLVSAKLDKSDSDTLVYKDVLVAQLGAVASLPASTGGRKTKFAFDVYPSGSPKNFQVSSDAALTKDQMTSLTGAAGDVLEKRAESHDELAALQRKRQILEEKQKIADLENGASQ